MGSRKARSDKKKDVKPTIKIALKDAIYRLSFITKTPVKEVCESMINYGVKNHLIIDRLIPYFIRDIYINDSLLKGSLDNSHFPRYESGECGRISFRLTQAAHNNISILAYAMDLNVSRIGAILLHECMHDLKFLNYYTNQYLQNELSYKQTLELKEMLRYITKNTNVDASMASLLSTIVHEVAPVSNSVENVVDEFIIHNWREKK